MSEDLKKLVLEKRKENRLVYSSIEGFISVDIDEFIKQPADGILYDLNRLEEVTLTFIDDPKWANDFAVALTIRELKSIITQLEAENTKLLEDGTRMLHEKAAYIEQLVATIDKLEGGNDET